MEYQDYGPVRWKLLIGQNPGPTERKAVCMLYGMIRTYLPYILTVCDHPEEITGNDHMICIGTLEGNGELARLAAERKNAEAELNRARGKLANPGFVSKAPQALIDAEREKAEKYARLCEQIEEKMRALGG